MSDDQVYAEYMSKWRDSLSVMYIDTENDLMMGELIIEMRGALRRNEPLDDSVFGLSDRVLM